jgi:hypothetical protein
MATSWRGMESGQAASSYLPLSGLSLPGLSWRPCCSCRPSHSPGRLGRPRWLAGFRKHRCQPPSPRNQAPRGTGGRLLGGPPANTAASYWPTPALTAAWVRPPSRQSAAFRRRWGSTWTGSSALRPGPGCPSRRFCRCCGGLDRRCGPRLAAGAGRDRQELGGGESGARRWGLRAPHRGLGAKPPALQRPSRRRGGGRSHLVCAGRRGGPAVRLRWIGWRPADRRGIRCVRSSSRCRQEDFESSARAGYVWRAATRRVSDATDRPWRSRHARATPSGCTRPGQPGRQRRAGVCGGGTGWPAGLRPSVP